MLTVKAPLEITAKTSYLRDPESFYHRIVGNYSLMETRVDKEDLLHITTTPPEIYITEGEGISSILNSSIRNENNYNKVEILNNVLNRIIASADVNLTYQDRVFITDALYRLGIRDDRKFMESFYKMAEETKNTNTLINLYLEQGQNLRSLVELVKEHTEKEKTTETKNLEKEEKNFLYNNIFDRLSTGAVYQIVSNFNRSVDYNSVDKNEYSISEQSFTAQNILLSMMRENAHVSEKNLFFLNDNTYEQSIENADSEVTNVKNDINGAVMIRLLQNIYRTGFEKFYLDKSTYFKFEDTFYKASDQIISKLISNFGSTLTNNETTRVLNEVHTNQINSELQLFSYSQKYEMEPEEVQNIEEILQNIENNNQEINRNTFDYLNRIANYSIDEFNTTERQLRLPEELSHRTINKQGDTEVFQNTVEILQKLEQNNQELNQNTFEYLNRINNYSTEEFKNSEKVLPLPEAMVLRMIGEQADTKVFQSIAEKIFKSSGPVTIQRILNEYVETITAKQSLSSFSDNRQLSFESLELLNQLSPQSESDFTVENLEQVKDIIRDSIEINNSEKKEYLATITNSELSVLENFVTEKKADKKKKDELINLISESARVRFAEKKSERIREILKEIGSEISKVTVSFEPSNIYQVEGEEETETPEKIENRQSEVLELEHPEEAQESGEETTQAKIFINKTELFKLFLQSINTELPQKEARPETVREAIREIDKSLDKPRTGYTESGLGYEAYKEASEEMQPEQGATPETTEAELVHERITDRVTDEDIKTLTENINRIDSLNEERRQKYLEVIKSISSKEKEAPAVSPFEKTRKMAELSLTNPEKLMEQLHSETVVRESKEKEILTQLKDIFPEQSLEIYQMLNKYQSNPEQIFNSTQLRSAEVGELIYDINNAQRDLATESKETAKAREELAQEEIAAVERAKRAAAKPQTRGRITPVETVHKMTETLSSEELNEQLEMMQHNLKRQIKEEVNTDLITENHTVNAKEVITTDNTSQQISEYNIQRMIDNTVRSEMNSISNQVMTKLERQMRNEKIRRGY